MGRDLRETWARRLERFRRSGLTAKKFARREGVNARTLSWWRWKLGREEQVCRATVAKQPRRRGAIEFVEVVNATGMSGMSAAGAGAFEVDLGRGYRVRVPASFEAEALERLLGVLEGR